MKRLMRSLAAAALFVTAPALAASDDDIRAAFERFVTAQNAHDAAAVRALLWDSPEFLWITRGAAIWGREAAMKRFEALYQGTWKLSPDRANLKVIRLGADAAQLYVPITFNIGAAGQPAPDAPFLMNQTLVRTAGGWRIASILPIPLPPAAAAATK